MRGVGQHHGALRRALLDEALKFLEAGDHTFSLRALARNAGVSAAAPYHHFGDKMGILAAVASEGFQSLGEALAAAEHPDPCQKLSQMILIYHRFALEHLAHYQVMFDPSVELSSFPELDTSARAAFSRLVIAVGAAMATRGPVDNEEMRARAALIWSSSHGAVLLAGQGAFEKLGVEDMGKRIAENALRIALGD